MDTNLKLSDMIDEVTRLREENKKIGELEKTITELRRTLLLPCSICKNTPLADGQIDPETELWENLADNLLLLEPVWHQLQDIRLDLSRSGNVIKAAEVNTNELIKLKSELTRAERMKGAAQSEPDLSLFSLFPFSNGAFSAVAEMESIKVKKRVPLSRENAVQRCKDLLMEMIRVYVDQRIELNTYIQNIGQESIQVSKKSEVILEKNKLDEPNLETFLYDEDFDDDADEVEL